MLFLSTYYIVQWKIEPLKWTCLFKGMPSFLQEMLWHARVAKKNNVAFYKIVSASSKGKQHPSLEESCLEGYNIAFSKEQTLWDKHIFCTTKCCLNNPFLKNIVFVRYHFQWFQVWRTRAKPLKVRNQNLGIPIKHQSNGVPKEVGDRAVFTVHFLWWLSSHSNSMKTPI